MSRVLVRTGGEGWLLACDGEGNINQTRYLNQLPS